MGTSVISLVTSLREDAALLEKNADQLRKFLQNPETDEECKNKGECIANAILALRKFEEGRMRLGEILKHLNQD